jgi:hypothetical protein
MQRNTCRSSAPGCFGTRIDTKKRYDFTFFAFVQFFFENHDIIVIFEGCPPTSNFFPAFRGSFTNPASAHLEKFLQVLRAFGIPQKNICISLVLVRIWKSIARYF